MTTRFNGHSGEVDHLVSRELGGSNMRANVFPETASRISGAHEKDRLHVEVCAGRLRLRTTNVILEELHVGTEGVFADAGFTEVSRPTLRRVVMRVHF